MRTTQILLLVAVILTAISKTITKFLKDLGEDKIPVFEDTGGVNNNTSSGSGSGGSGIGNDVPIQIEEKGIGGTYHLKALKNNQIKQPFENFSIEIQQNDVVNLYADGRKESAGITNDTGKRVYGLSVKSEFVRNSIFGDLKFYASFYKDGVLQISHELLSVGNLTTPFKTVEVDKVDFDQVKINLVGNGSVVFKDSDGYSPNLFQFTEEVDFLEVDVTKPLYEYNKTEF